MYIEIFQKICSKYRSINIHIYMFVKLIWAASTPLVPTRVKYH